MIHNWVSHIPGTNNTLLGSEASAIAQKLFSATASANSIAQRDASGDVIVPISPTGSTSAASMDYVDTFLGSRYWAYLEEKEILSNSTSFDFSTVLDGDQDGAYFILGRIVNQAGANVNVDLRLNGAVASAGIQFFTSSGTSVSATRTTGINATFMSLANGNTQSFALLLPASSTGTARHLFSKTNRSTTGTLTLEDFSVEITTPSSGTNLTSVGIETSSANGLGAGSIFWLARRK